MLKKTLFVVLGMILAVSVCSPLLAANEPAANTVIAVVKGDNITYGQIKIAEKDVIAAYEKSFGKKPAAADIPRFKAQKEKIVLQSHIANLAIDKLIKEQNITVKDEEIQAKESEMIKQYYGREDLADVVKVENEHWTALSRSLKDALKDPAKEKDIYNKNLTKLMSYDSWKMQLKHYNSLDKVALLDKSLPLTPESIRNSFYPRAKGELMDGKIKEYLAKNYPVTTAEIEKYASVNKKPLAVRDMDRLGEYLMMHKWMQDLVKKKDIQVKEASFKDTLGNL